MTQFFYSFAARVRSLRSGETFAATEGLAFLRRYSEIRMEIGRVRSWYPS